MNLLFDFFHSVLWKTKKERYYRSSNGRGGRNRTLIKSFGDFYLNRWTTPLQNLLFYYTVFFYNMQANLKNIFIFYLPSKSEVFSSFDWFSFCFSHNSSNIFCFISNSFFENPWCESDNFFNIHSNFLLCLYYIKIIT